METTIALIVVFVVLIGCGLWALRKTTECDWIFSVWPCCRKKSRHLKSAEEMKEMFEQWDKEDQEQA